MTTIKNLLLEYLTVEQREKFSGIKMTQKARKASDHFFGKDNDTVEKPLNQFEKSEVHREVEHHIGRELTHDEYRNNQYVNDKGNLTTIGKRIKDKGLQQRFAADKSQASKDMGSKFTTATHRGIEVAGQSNSAPDKLHPTGHSWGTSSCKDANRDAAGYSSLKHEVRHGTIAHFVKDDSGKEIYRATFQPHYNEKGHAIWKFDADYGIKHPEFVKSAHEAVAKLNDHKNTEGVFKLHKDVYGDANRLGAPDTYMHDKVSHADIHKMIDNKQHLDTISQHPNLSDDHIHKLIDIGGPDVSGLAEHPNLTSDHIHKLIKKDVFGSLSMALARHPNLNKDHIHTLVNSGEYASVKNHPNFDVEHLKSPAINLSHVAAHPKATAEMLDAAHKAVLSGHITYEGDNVKRSLSMHQNTPPHVIDHLIGEATRGNNRIADNLLNRDDLSNDQTMRLLKTDHHYESVAMATKRMSPEMVHHIVTHDEYPLSTKKAVLHTATNIHDHTIQHFLGSSISKINSYGAPIESLATNKSLKSHHISAIMDHINEYSDKGTGDRASQSIVNSPAFGPEHIDGAIRSKHAAMRQGVLSSVHAQPKHFEKLAHDEDDMIRSMAFSMHQQPKHVVDAELHKDIAITKRGIFRGRSVYPEHITHALENPHDMTIHDALADNTVTPHFKHEHISKLLDNPKVSYYIKDRLRKHPNFIKPV